METDEVRRDDADGVITLTFTRDTKRNAVTHEMFGALADAVRDLGDDDAQRVLVITAEGRYFTSGFDFKNLRTNVGEGTDGIIRGSNMRRQYRGEAYHDLFDEMESIEKPIILAAQANCFGVGIEMGVSCDFRFAADTALFALPEVMNVATIPGSGGVSRLTRLIGPEQARSIGLVHDVFPAATFAEQVQEFARKLCGMPREALGLAKVAIDTADTVDRRTARDVDRLAQTLLFMSDEFKDKVNAFNAASAARNAPAS
jgi:enoyl-CoA hydratase/carnithine racemase